MRSACRRLCCSALSIPSESSRRRSICGFRVLGVSIRRMSADGRVSSSGNRTRRVPVYLLQRARTIMLCRMQHVRTTSRMSSVYKSLEGLYRLPKLLNRTPNTRSTDFRALVMLGKQLFHKRPRLSPGQYEDPKTRTYSISEVVKP
jgi:hypothetical protein